MNLEKIAKGYADEDEYVDVAAKTFHFQYAVSEDQPLLSKGFYFCRALVLSNKKRIALAHIWPDIDVRKCIAYMVGTLKATPKELKAAIVEVDQLYNYDLEIGCRDAGIEVAQVYRQKFMKKRWYDILNIMVTNDLERNVAVDPKSQRVCIYRVPLKQYNWMQL